MRVLNIEVFEHMASSSCKVTITNGNTLQCSHSPRLHHQRRVSRASPIRTSAQHDRPDKSDTSTAAYHSLKAHIGNLHPLGCKSSQQHICCHIFHNGPYSPEDQCTFCYYHQSNSSSFLGRRLKHKVSSLSALSHDFCRYHYNRLVLMCTWYRIFRSCWRPF